MWKSMMHLDVSLSNFKLLIGNFIVLKSVSFCFEAFYCFRLLRSCLYYFVRFFLGSNKVMQVALGRTAADEITPNIHKVSKVRIFLFSHLILFTFWLLTRSFFGLYLSFSFLSFCVVMLDFFSPICQKKRLKGNQQIFSTFSNFVLLLPIFPKKLGFIFAWILNFKFSGRDTYLVLISKNICVWWFLDWVYLP